MLHVETWHNCNYNVNNSVIYTNVQKIIFLLGRYYQVSASYMWSGYVKRMAQQTTVCGFQSFHLNNFWWWFIKDDQMAEWRWQPWRTIAPCVSSAGASVLWQVVLHLVGSHATTTHWSLQVIIVNRFFVYFPSAEHLRSWYTEETTAINL